MKRYITILFLFFGGFCFGQTVHTVKVSVGQGSDCPVVATVPPSTVIRVFPNPATSTISIQSAMENASFKLLNVQGKVIKGMQHLNAHTTIDISQVPEGIYILQVNNVSEMRTMKIIVQ